jgi:hypothetical protein
MLHYYNETKLKNSFMPKIYFLLSDDETCVIFCFPDDKIWQHCLEYLQKIHENNELASSLEFTSEKNDGSCELLSTTNTEPGRNASVFYIKCRGKPCPFNIKPDICLKNMKNQHFFEETQRFLKEEKYSAISHTL